MSVEIPRRTFLKRAVTVGAALAVASALSPISVFASESKPTQPQPPAKDNHTVTTEDRVYNPGEIVEVGYNASTDVFLTFDDDWILVPKILDIAREKQAQITFFPVGKAVKKNKSLWKEVMLEGHTVENHTWSHKNLNRLTTAQARDQIVRQRDLVEELADQAGVLGPSGEPYRQVFLRGPGGRTNLNVQAIARDLDLVIARWTISSGGTSRKATDDSVYHHVVDRLGNGVIVLQHAKAHDVNMLPAIIDETRNQGYQVEKSLRDGIKTSVYP